MAKVFDFNRCKLGKKAPRHDPRRLHLSSYLKAGAIDSVPTTFDFSAGVVYQMWLNDQLGDCTCAASAGWFTTWITRAGGAVNFTDSEVEAEYEAVGGYVPGLSSTDNGAVIADVLQYLLKTGLAGHKLGAYGDVSIASEAALKAACYYCEGLNIGIQLPTYCENTTEWLTASNQIAGGHDILLVGVNAAGNFIGITWGEKVEVSYAFLVAQCDEAHFGLSQDQLNGSGLAGNGLNLSAMQADVASVGKFDVSPMPVVTPPVTPPVIPPITPPIVPPAPAGPTEASLQAAVDADCLSEIQAVAHSPLAAHFAVPALMALKSKLDATIEGAFATGGEEECAACVGTASRTYGHVGVANL